MNSESIKKILEAAYTIAIVGISDSPEKDSYKVAAYLEKQGYRIFPVNPKYESILGEKCYPSLSDIPEKVDIVDIFRRPEYVTPVIQEAIKIKASVVWMQLGVVNNEAADIAGKAGLKVIMDRCIKIENRRHF